MATEVWIRNPDLCIKECAELLVTNLAWDRGYLQKRNIDPVGLATLYYPQAIDYRLLLIGEQGTAELRRGDGFEYPHAVYPTWEYGDDLDILIELLAHPVGEDVDLCADRSTRADERPVFGQEHRVVIIRPPAADTGVGRKFFRLLKDLQEDYPKAIIHVHGLYSYRVAFGLGFRSVDIEPRLTAKKGKVILPSGKEMTWEHTAKAPQWVTLLGFRPADLDVPRNRCLYNIKSAVWAGKYYTENFKFRSSGRALVDPDDPTNTAPRATKVANRLPKPFGGDMLLCDSCSIQDICKFYRSGGVCSVPGAESAGLAKFFKTRNADTIIEGLGDLLAAQSARLQRGMEDEEEYGELDPEVTKILNSLFGNGVKLAKLINPALNTPKVGITFNTGAAAVAAARPNALTARVVAELEAQGVPRDQITPEMVMSLIEPEAGAIEDAAVVGDDE